MPMGTRASKESAPYQAFILALCAYALFSMLYVVVLRPDPEIAAVLSYADAAVCAVFFIDFLLTLRRSENRLRYLYTWGWLDLLSSIPTLDVARWGRVARLARLLRILRVVRATKTIGQLVLERRTESTFLAASLAALLVLVVGSISILHVETDSASNIKGAEDAVWWSLTTMTTVGYGDRFPVTSERRFVAALLMSAGVGLFGMVSGLLAAWFVAVPAKSDTDEVQALKDEVERLRALLGEGQLPQDSSSASESGSSASDRSHSSVIS